MGSDKELCIRIQKGDSPAFRILFDRYYGQLFRFLCHRGMEQAVAEDMVQDIFVRIWQNRDRLKAADSLRPYLFQAARNELHMFLRKKKVRDTHADGVRNEAISYTLPFASFDQKEHIDKAIATLPPTLREVFVLHRFDGLSYKEIAQLQEVSIKTVESRMSKALKHLRHRLIHLVNLILFFLS